MKAIRNLFSIFDLTTEINNLPLNWTRTATGLIYVSYCFISTNNELLAVKIYSSLVVSGFSRN